MTVGVGVAFAAAGGPCGRRGPNSGRMNRSATVPTAAGTFSPQRPLLRTDGHGYSPAVLQILVEAAGRLPSFADAAFALHLAGVDISPRHLGRVAQEIGAEMAQARDDKATENRRRQLPPWA